MIINVGDVVELDYPSLVNYDFRDTIARYLEVGKHYTVTKSSSTHIALNGVRHLYMKERFKLVKVVDVTEGFRRVPWIEILLADGHIKYSEEKDSWFSHLESKLYVVEYINGAWKMYAESNSIQPRNPNGIAKLETGKQTWVGGIL